jgi:predicted GH43/DUF377 family glycosyl hydrolase
MERFKKNPILEPLAEHPWESRMVFNAGAVYEAGRVHILYRAIGDDGVSRLGYASSTDGYEIDERLPFPVFEPSISEEGDGCEDPRMTFLEGQYFMCYTALRDRVSGPYQVSMTSIAVDDFTNKRWKWGNRWLPFSGIQNKDAALFPRKINGKYLLLHRIEPDICVAYSDDLMKWCNVGAIVRPERDRWDSLKVGIAGPPIEIDEGWLLIYHGVDFNNVYRLGSILLDKNNPEKVIYRSQKPILEPVEEYERYGAVPNVVFSCGAVKIDDQILIYYGGADSVLCVANYSINELTHEEIEILTRSS